MKKLLLSIGVLCSLHSISAFAWSEQQNQANDLFNFFKKPEAKPTLSQSLGRALLTGKSGDAVMGTALVGGAAVLGSMVVNNNNDLAQKYEDDLLSNPGQEEANRILAELQTMNFAQTTESGPGYLIFAKKIGIGHEFAQAQVQFENTPEYQDNFKLLSNYFNRFEQNPDWQEDYATVRYKRFLEFYAKAPIKYPAMDESTQAFITQLSKLKREYNFLNNAANPYLTTQQKEKIKQVFSCQNPTYRKMIYDSLFLTPSKFEASYVYVLVADDIWYKSGSLKKEQYKRSIGSNQFDMNSYSRLNYLGKSYDGTEDDHIPSFAASKEYMKNQGYNISTAEATLKKNTSAMTVLKLLHQHGRSWGNKNDISLINLDASNLKLAALKDFNTYIQRMKDKTIFNGSNEYQASDFDNIAKSITILHERNKLLCLYN